MTTFIKELTKMKKESYMKQNYFLENINFQNKKPISYILSQPPTPTLCKQRKRCEAPFSELIIDLFYNVNQSKFRLIIRELFYQKIN